MEIEFRDKQKLNLMETDNAPETGFSIAIIKSCRKRLFFIRNAPDEMTLRNWKSLHYEKLKGDREGQKSIKLNDQWRLIFQVDNTCKPPKVIILSLEDYH